MKYNYPLTPENAQKVHDIITSVEDLDYTKYGSLFWLLFIGGITAIVIAAVMVIISIIEKDEWILMDSGFPGLTGVLLIFIAFGLAGGNTEEDALKHDIIEASSESLQNDEYHDDFQRAVSRYLETQNIDLEKNCALSQEQQEKLDMRNTQYDNSVYMYTTEGYIHSTLLCSNEPQETLSRTLQVIDNEDNIRVIQYDTTANPDHNYLTVSISEINEEAGR